MRLFLCIAVIAFTLGGVVLWVRAHRTTPFCVRATGLGMVVVDLHDGEHMTSMALMESARLHPIRDLPFGVYAVVFDLVEDRAFCIALRYQSSYRQRLDLDVSPVSDQSGWHVRLCADGASVIFEADVPFSSATEQHPCIITL